MASFTLNTTAFPDGTSIGAYPSTNWTGPGSPTGTPVGSATNSQTVTGASVTFTGLSSGTRYYATDAAGTRYVSFQVGEDIAEGEGASHAELAAGLAGLLGTPTALTGRAFDTTYRNTTGEPVELSIDVGILADPGQNGHIHLDISSDGSAWSEVAWHTLRNASDVPLSGEIGSGGTLQALVKDGWYWRIRTATVSGWVAPTYVLDGSGSSYVRVFKS